MLRIHSNTPDPAHYGATSMGTDLDASKRYPDMSALYDRYATLPEIAVNTSHQVDESEQIMGWRPRIVSGTPYKSYQIVRGRPEHLSTELDAGLPVFRAVLSMEMPVNAGVGLHQVFKNALQRRLRRRETGLATIWWRGDTPSWLSSQSAVPMMPNVYPAPVDKSILPSEIVQRFSEIAQREDNWDGLGSLKPKEISRERAQHILEKLFYFVISKKKEDLWFTPFISSDEEGYVTVEWTGGKRELHLRIEENEIEYVTLEKINTTRKMGGDTISGDDCFETWKWLINEQ